MNVADTPTCEPGHGWDDYSNLQLLDVATKHPEQVAAEAAALVLSDRIVEALRGAA